MKTRFLSTSASDLAVAAELLRSGELVAFPTETVFGLGADALNATAIEKIFVAKGRPSDNPLIVHLASTIDVLQVASGINSWANQLMIHFWPGPLTIVLPKRDEVPSQVTADLSTVAVRVPSHPVAHELIRLAGTPIAAPSANRSGRPSSTTWQAVAEDLDGRIAAIVCGQPASYGLESTVVDATSCPPRILRPGGLSFEELQVCIPSIEPYSPQSADLNQSVANSPGLKYRHYQPSAKVVVVDSSDRFVNQDRPVALPQPAFYIGLAESDPSSIDLTQFQTVELCSDIAGYAAKLFDFFRQADKAKAKIICCQRVSEVGIGVALMDRLNRASHSHANE